MKGDDDDADEPLVVLVVVRRAREADKNRHADDDGKNKDGEIEYITSFSMEVRPPQCSRSKYS